MATPFLLDPADSQPLWRQIELAVRHQVGSGGLAPGAAMPSVRDLAKGLRVNPATVSKAYQRLVDDGVLAVRRGDGTYVAEAPPTVTADERRGRLADAATRYAIAASHLDAPRDEAVAAVVTALDLFRKPTPQKESRHD